MKIFRKHYVRRLYHAKTLEEIVKVLEPWGEEVLQPDSLFLSQVASYKLRIYGCSYAPTIFKQALGRVFLQLYEMEDLRASLRLAIVEAYRSYDSGKGRVDYVNWLSWKIPYEMSKLLTWRIVRYIYPLEEYINPRLEEFEEKDEQSRQFGIITSEISLARRKFERYQRLWEMDK